MRITKVTLRQQAAALPASSDNYLCQQCQLFSKCSYPFLHETILMSAVDNNRILFVTSQPSLYEGAQGKQFSSPLGKHFKSYVLKAIGLRPEQCAFVSAIACSSNKTTIAPQVEWCRAFVFQAIVRVMPSKIVLLGADAARSVLCLKTPILKDLTNMLHLVHVEDGKIGGIPAIVTYGLAYALKDLNILQVIRQHIERFVYDKLETKVWPAMNIMNL